ncbi:hypothetical protein V9T40_012909 [Parthenolecanium corni]|uniref:Uncharacterized protein n=1 Tax=Parthenolecanium corni TaxID=536013 RepID=A0AAN9TC01_9HEMI
MSPKCKYQQLDQLEEKTSKMTFKMVQDAQLLLTLVRQRSATMSEQNKISAAQYVSDVRNDLKECITVGIQKSNQIFLDMIRDLESELTYFDFVIDHEVDSYLKDVGFDIQIIQSELSKTEYADAAQVLEKASYQIEHLIRSLVGDIDKIYSQYGSYIIKTVENFMKNGSDRFSIILNTQHRGCNSSISDRINICFNITSQNDVVYKNLLTVAQLINFVQNTTDTVKDVVYIIYSEGDKNNVAKFEKSIDTLMKITDDARHEIDSILENDYNFLGSTVRKFAYEHHSVLQEFMIRRMKIVIQSLARSLQTTMDNSEIVKSENHHKKLVYKLKEKLEGLENEMKSKALFIADAAQRSEFEQKANLEELKHLLKTRFADITRVMKTAFNNQRNRLTTNMKYHLGYIVRQQLPYISSLTLQSYIPSDICPLALDYQKFIKNNLKQTVDKKNGEVITDKFISDNYFGVNEETGAAMAPYIEYDSLSSPNESEVTAQGKVEPINGTDVRL